MNKKQTFRRKYLLLLLSSFVFLAVSNNAMAGPLTSNCNAKTSQGPEGVISRINCLRDELLKLQSLEKKIKIFIGFGQSIRGRIDTKEQKKYKCRSPILMKTYLVPKTATGGRCSHIKTQHSNAYNTYYRDYCLGYSSVSKEMSALHNKVISLKKSYEACFDKSVIELIPSNVRKGDPSDFTGHSSFNNRASFVIALNQLRNRWKTNDYETEMKLLARTCNDLLSFTESKYPNVAQTNDLNCS
jgi:hypothetical protein